MPKGIKKGIDWSAQPLGQVSDGVIARRLGVTPEAVYFARKSRSIPPLRSQRPRCDPAAFDAELGTETDVVVAARHGVHWQQVAYRRRKLKKRSTRVDWDRQPLGEVPDIVLAKKLGVDNSAVYSARKNRKIPKWREERLCPCGAKYIAFHLDQRFCGYRCQRYHWHLVNEDGIPPEAADLALAMAALRRTLRKKGKGLPCGVIPMISW